MCSPRVRETLSRCGLAVEACNPEAGPGQFEINLRAAGALRAADEAFLLKSAVKEVAAGQGLLATFMAKPRSDWPGNSCHLHLSLRAGDDEVFADPADGSPTMRHFIGGLLSGMAELSALLAPTPNSYRRFVPYSWAATTATWGVDTRSAGLRAICRGDGATRVEHRQAGADANPYLAVSAALAAGLDGVQRGASRRSPSPATSTRAPALTRRFPRRSARRPTARAQRARPRLARRRRRRALRGHAACRARRAGGGRHRLGDRPIP